MRQPGANGQTRVAAYMAAGYSGHQNEKSQYIAATKTLMHPLVKAEIERLTALREQTDAAQAAWDIDRIRAEHWRLAALAEARGDLATATRNIEGLARTVGAYRDGIDISSERSKQLTAQEAAEAERLARLLLLGPASAGATPDTAAATPANTPASADTPATLTDTLRLVGTDTDTQAQADPPVAPHAAGGATTSIASA